ncbi:urea ABC transporter substrate-binding protein [Paraburkholderia acidisoli]|uniref:Transporter substrate-binding protein n=1 Tax=Paraburkholderia acidisoli TaxID=2571748 RepID=A0A7Z2GNY4_9BURK|nr:ABC transporter substrate-binding protein [Paraburkholderia acidisoli]QGZ65280.1 transporter substrate-binding protein [Paraburkholderia acidisoli]
MSMNRRRFLSTSAASVAGATLLGLNATRAFAQGKINVAAIYDLSGGLDIYGKPVMDALRFAAEEINAQGGLLGQQLNFISYDAQSNMQLYAQFAQQAALRDRAAVVHAGITSASREIVRPVLDRYRTLYFYDNQYEGGVCDRNYFGTGVTPAQTVAKLVPWAVRNWGKKVYIVAADYNYGQIVSEWVKKYVAESSGKVVATEFFPLDVTDFGATISKIQAASPDFIWSALVGGAHMSFYRQWKATGMTTKIPLASTTFAGGNEHIVLSPEECNGFMVCQNYLQELPGAVNADFVKRFHARYGQNYPYITELAMGAYQGFMLWAAGVRKANSVDRMKVIEALETGIAIDAPSGKVTLDPATHHCILDVHIARVNNHKLELVQSFPQQKPADTAAVCNLIKNPADNRQYAIKF